MWWFQHGLCALPAALVVWSSTTFMLSYTTAILLGHVNLLLPYLSDTGTEVPERCIFGFMLTISSFLGLATVYVRYKQVQALISGEYGLQILNYIGLLLGILSSCGISVVANFQKTEMISMHLLGAGLTFGPGALYILVQTAMSYRMQPRFHGKDILWARAAVGFWAMASIISLFVSSVILYDDLPGVDVTNKLHWHPGEPGYVAHQVSAASEWSLAFCLVGFFLTYIRDFQKIRLCVQAVLQSNYLHDYPHYDGQVHLHHGERSPLLAGSI